MIRNPFSSHVEFYKPLEPSDDSNEISKTIHSIRASYMLHSWQRSPLW